jgi:hypothetical protein
MPLTKLNKSVLSFHFRILLSSLIIEFLSISLEKIKLEKYLGYLIAKLDKSISEKP